MGDLRVWIGNQAEYAARLVGEWVDVDDIDELRAAFDRITRGGRDEHYIGDIEGPAWFREIIGEWGTLDLLGWCIDLAEAIDADDIDEEMFSAWWGITSTSYGRPLDFDPAEIVEKCRDEYLVSGDDERDAAMAYAYELRCHEDVVDHLDPRSCIDWDQYARHLANDFTLVRHAGTVYVFQST